MVPTEGDDIPVLREIHYDPSSANMCHKSVSLIALATEFRISKLAAVIRTSALPRFGAEDASVSLARHPWLFPEGGEDLTHDQTQRNTDKEGKWRAPHIRSGRIIQLYIFKTPINSERLWMWPDTGRNAMLSTRTW